MQTTPTYAVAIMDNLLSYGCSIAETLDIYTDLVSKASTAYHKAIKAGVITAETPLCYRDLAFKDNLRPLLEAYRHSGRLPELQLDQKANVLERKLVLDETPLKTLILL